MNASLRFGAGMLWLACAACEPSSSAEPTKPAAAPAPADAAGAPAPRPPSAPDGKALFAAHCAVCHGPEGRGDGPAAYLLWPRPRDFSKGLFKIRSTPSGSLPTDEDLLHVITNGMLGSSMPAWRQLPEADRRALVEHVKTLTQFFDQDEGKAFNYFAQRGPGRPVAVPPEPPATTESVARGRAVYLKQDCAKCHGDAGRGDGPSAADLKDDWGSPIRPNDFTRGIFKGGSSNRDIYLRFSTGMSGTPMPEFGPTLMTDEQRWGLVHYVKALTQGRAEALAAALPPGEAIAARRMKAGALPGDSSDPAWEAIPAASVALQLLHQRLDAPRTLQVRTAHDGQRLAFLFSWEDSTVSSLTLRPEDFRDAVAVQFALRGMDTPFPMGGPDRPVNLWHWKADWQADLGMVQDMELVHPGMVNEWYPFQSGDPTNDRGSRPASAPSHDRAFLTGWAAGNLMSNPLRRSPVEDLVAAGFGTITALPFERQTVQGRGAWAGGRWTVQITRSFQPPDDCCVAFAPGREVPIALAVWDGGAGDRNGQKSVTTWYRLTIEK